MKVLLCAGPKTERIKEYLEKKERSSLVIEAEPVFLDAMDKLLNSGFTWDKFAVFGHALDDMERDDIHQMLVYISDAMKDVTQNKEFILINKGDKGIDYSQVFLDVMHNRDGARIDMSPSVQMADIESILAGDATFDASKVDKLNVTSDVGGKRVSRTVIPKVDPSTIPNGMAGNGAGLKKKGSVVGGLAGFTSGKGSKGNKKEASDESGAGAGKKGPGFFGKKKKELPVSDDGNDDWGDIDQGDDAELTPETSGQRVNGKKAKSNEGGLQLTPKFSDEDDGEYGEELLPEEYSEEVQSTVGGRSQTGISGRKSQIQGQGISVSGETNGASTRSRKPIPSISQDDASRFHGDSLRFDSLDALDRVDLTPTPSASSIPVSTPTQQQQRVSQQQSQEVSQRGQRVPQTGQGSRQVEQDFESEMREIEPQEFEEEMREIEPQEMQGSRSVRNSSIPQITPNRTSQVRGNQQTASQIAANYQTDDSIGIEPMNVANAKPVVNNVQTGLSDFMDKNRSIPRQQAANLNGNGNGNGNAGRRRVEESQNPEDEFDESSDEGMQTPPQKVKFGFGAKKADSAKAGGAKAGGGTGGAPRVGTNLGTKAQQPEEKVANVSGKKLKKTDDKVAEMLKRQKIIVVTGNERSGKSGTVANLASVAQSVGMRTLVLDLDFYGRGMCLYFPQDINPEENYFTNGISNAMRSPYSASDFTWRISDCLDILGLDVSVCNVKTHEDTLNSAKLSDLLSNIRLQYDLILIDLPFKYINKFNSCLSVADRIVYLTENDPSSLINIVNSINPEKFDNFVDYQLFRTKCGFVINRYNENGCLSSNVIEPHNFTLFLDEITEGLEFYKYTVYGTIQDIPNYCRQQDSGVLLCAYEGYDKIFFDMLYCLYK